MSPTWLIDLDQQVFHTINTSWSNLVGDYVLPLMRNRLFWVPLYVFVLGGIILYYKRKAWIVMVGLAITIGISDALSSRVIKPYVKRPRPCHWVQRMEVQVRVGCGSGYSFPSSHATNHFAMALFMSGLIGFKRKLSIAWLTWAALIGYAQIYVGVHYPLDVIMGAMLGSIIGIRGVRWVQYFLNKRQEEVI